MFKIRLLSQTFKSQISLSNLCSTSSLAKFVLLFQSNSTFLFLLFFNVSALSFNIDIFSPYTILST
ncbi:MAG: hypothetical protein LBC61_04795 [Candidatus Peribacteria bacterium]|nr:hypothetical protein [Candidatus Peribacteria bacterium]